MPCGVVDVGLDLFVHIDHKDCTPDEIGPPGFPGGLVSFSTDPDPDLDPPYPQKGEGKDDGEDEGEKTEDPEKKTATNEEEATESSQDSTVASRPRSAERSQDNTITSGPRSTESSQKSTITSRPRSIAISSRLSSARKASSSSASATNYMVVAAVGADQINIQQTLRKLDPEKGGSYEPDIGNTSVSGGTWVYYELAPYEAEKLSSHSDILDVVTCATVVSMFGAGNSPSAPPQTVDATVSLETLNAPSSATLSASIVPKRRRYNVGFEDSSDLPNGSQAKKKSGLQKRDPGTRLVRQRRTPVSCSPPPIIPFPSPFCSWRLVPPSEKRLLVLEPFLASHADSAIFQNTYPEDLSVFAWAPRVPSIAGVDYIFEETKGEYTWAYLMDTGVAYRHWVCVSDYSHESESNTEVLVLGVSE